MKILFTVLYVAVFAVAYCQKESVDSSFGNNGFVITPADDADLFYLGRAAALQPDGKILMNRSRGSMNSIPEFIRYMPDGTVDSSFGRNGIVSVDAISVTVHDDDTMTRKPSPGDITAITVQPDGKIIIAGNTQPFFVGRFLPDGKRDDSFGNNGFFSNMEFGGFDNVSDMVLQPDGKIVLTGGKPSSFFMGFESSVLMRLNGNGSIDSAFAEDGRFEIIIDDPHKPFVVVYNRAIALQPDGKIITIGYQWENMFTTHNFVVSRYNINGTPDSSFGKKGYVITKTNNYSDDPASIAVQQDGKIVTGGRVGIDRNTWAMIALRYDTHGKLDRSFGKNGKVTILFKNKKVQSCKSLLLPNGKIILAGSVQPKENKDEEDFALCSITADGAVNIAFGINGKQILASKQSSEYFQTALLQPDGKIVLIGSSWYNEQLTAVLARYDSIK